MGREPDEDAEDDFHELSVPDQLQVGAARIAYERLRTWIEFTAKQFAPGQVPVLRHYLPSGEAVRVHDLGYGNPWFILIYASDSRGQNMCILTHVGSLQLVLAAVRPTPDEPAPRPIGFRGSLGWEADQRIASGGSGEGGTVSG